jgi:tetratricopeptide (TPR) repeat protein
MPDVDESALRYFARTGDQRRLDAEMARLKLLYPDWIPPANPAAPEVYVDPDLERMWALFAQEKYGDVRAAIAERRAREPDWEPPASLLELLDEADARVKLINASNAKQWNTVIDTAAAAPSLLTCAYVDVLWRVAEAFANTDRMPRAKDTYVYILTNCDNPQERIATVQKAADILPAADLDALLALGRGDEFATVQDLLLRRRLSVTSQDPNQTSPPEDLARLETLARDGDAADALLLGWYYYRHKEPRKALDWFDLARQRDATNAKAAEGYALALIDLGRFEESEAASYEWRDTSEDNLAAYLIAAVGLLAEEPPVRIPEEVLKRMADVIVREKSLQGGEQMGWYAYNFGQLRTASRWFETVLRWDREYEPGAYGLAVVRWAMNDRATVEAIKRDWASRSQRIADVGRPGRTELRGSRPVIDSAAYDGTYYDNVYYDAPRTPRVDAPAYVPREEVRDAVPVAPYVERPYVEQPYVERPYGEQPYVERPYVERPAVDRPYVEQPYVARPYVEPAAPPRAVATGGSRSCGTMSTPTRALSPSAALSRGWCLMDLNRPVEAAAAFEIALNSTSARTREDAAYGASLAHLRTGVTDKAWVAAAASPMSKRNQTELNLSILSQQATAAYADGRYIEAILALDERARLAPEQNDLMVLRGWAYFKLNRLAEAKRIFAAAAQTGYPEAQSGLAAVYEKQNRRLD